jgi:hypothetical protein
MEQQVRAIRTVVKAEGENIVVEVFKDATGKIVRQQSFSLEQLNATKVQVTKQFNDQVTRLDEMIAILEVQEA